MANSMGDDSRPRRILADLSSALRRDPKIDEFDFIYCPEPVVNRSPVVLEHHKLGLETWSIKLLYPYVYNNLMKRTAAVKDLKSLHEFSRTALLLNPECYTIWNMRKELVMKRYVKAEDELTFASVIQTKHPKSPETFIQRRWLLQQLFPHAKSMSTQRHPPGHQTQSNGSLPEDSLHSNGQATPRSESVLSDRQRLVVQGEMAACCAAASRYPSNYNAWSHRMWVLQCVARLNPAILKEELEETSAWVRQHISDHSGFNYRHFLLRSLLSCDQCHGDVLRLVYQELVLTSSLIHSFPGHEAIWYHRRSVISTGRDIVQVTHSPHHISPSSPAHQVADHSPDHSLDSPANGHGVSEDLTDADHVVQGEKEWLLLKDFSNASNPPCSKTARTTAQADCNAYEAYEEAASGDDPGGCAQALWTLLSKEDLFLETTYKKVSKGDRPLQARCIERHRKWLDNVQY